MSHSVLAVAAHPDDELLGCGGALALHALADDQVNVLILGEGGMSRPGAASNAVHDLKNAARHAARILGAQPPSFADLPDNRMDELPLLQIVQTIEVEIARVQPDIVYTHHGGDLNLDHRLVHQAVVTACRPLPQSTVRAVYGCETVSSTEWTSLAIDHTGFRPTRFVNIADVLERKLEALSCYQSEMRVFPHPRSLEAIRALATWRGSMVGLTAAEAFTVIREIVT